jgi:hypothetical protein
MGVSVSLALPKSEKKEQIFENLFVGVIKQNTLEVLSVRRFLRCPGTAGP